jgi:hypothetical protein
MGAGRRDTGRRETGRREDAAALDRDAAERVLRRAVELDDLPGAVAGDRDISHRALIEAAEELGIDPDDVRRAIAEEQLGLLADRHRPGDVVLGPDRFVAARLVDGRPDQVLEQVDAWMRKGRSLRRTRRNDGWAEYARRTDPVGATQRALRTVQGTERLQRVRRLRVVVADAGADRSLVGLVVDVSRSRTAAAAGGVTVAATGVLTAATTAVSVLPWAWLGVPVAAAGGVGVMAARKGYVSDVDAELESVLDAIASGSSPGSVLDDVAARLRRSPRA